MFYSISFSFHGVSENAGTIARRSSSYICEKDIYFFTNISKPVSCTCLFHSKCIENAFCVNMPCHGPRFFSKTLVGYLVNDQFKSDISDMPDFDFKNKLKGSLG